MQMYAMSRRLKGLNVSITSLHPGIVDTGLIRNFHGYKASYLYYIMNALGEFHVIDGLNLKKAIGPIFFIIILNSLLHQFFIHFTLFVFNYKSVILILML